MKKSTKIHENPQKSTKIHKNPRGFLQNPRGFLVHVDFCGFFWKIEKIFSNIYFHCYIFLITQNHYFYTMKFILKFYFFSIFNNFFFLKFSWPWELGSNLPISVKVPTITMPYRHYNIAIDHLPILFLIKLKK